MRISAPKFTLKPTDQNEICDLSSPHTYRTEIPNIVFHMNLDPWEFKAYCVLKKTAGDNGSCFKNTTTLSDEVGCSVPTLINIKKRLVEHRLIRITKRKKEDGGNMPDLIQIIDIWPQNMEYMMRLYPKNPKNDLSGFENPHGNNNYGDKADLGGGVKQIKGGTLNQL